MCYSKSLGNLRYAFTCDLLLNDKIIWYRGWRHEGIMSTTMGKLACLTINSYQIISNNLYISIFIILLHRKTRIDWDHVIGNFLFIVKEINAEYIFPSVHVTLSFSNNPLIYILVYEIIEFFEWRSLYRVHFLTSIHSLIRLEDSISTGYNIQNDECVQDCCVFVEEFRAL